MSNSALWKLSVVPDMTGKTSSLNIFVLGLTLPRVAYILHVVFPLL